MEGTHGTFNRPFLRYWKKSKLPNDSNELLHTPWLSKNQTVKLARYMLKQLYLSIDEPSIKDLRLAVHMSCNQIEEAILRVAAELEGFTIVTLNWDADTVHRVQEKVGLADCAMLIYSNSLDADRIEAFQNNIKIPKIVIEDLLPTDIYNYESESSTEEYPHWSKHFDEWPSHAIENKEKYVVFTSGTTSSPKGVRLSNRNVATGCQALLNAINGDLSTHIHLVMINPFHHVNATIIFELAMLHPNATVHLIQRYTTSYWSCLQSIAQSLETQYQSSNAYRLVAPLVSKHIDFLSSLAQTNKLPPNVTMESLKLALAPPEVVLLLGSAPVGYKTIQSLKTLLNKIPVIRFGSTETSLQVLSTPFNMNAVEFMDKFDAGWNHHMGFFIGSPSLPCIEMDVVKSVDNQSSTYMESCEPGNVGYLVCRGPNIMMGYVNGPNSIINEKGWYLGLGDLGYYFIHNNVKEFYWVSRSSEIIIKGGANYSCAQISDTVVLFILEKYNIDLPNGAIATCPVKSNSEHEDLTCTTIEIPNESFKSLNDGNDTMQSEPHCNAGAKTNIQEVLKTHLFDDLKASNLPKHIKPDYIRFATLPKTFKGTCDTKALQSASLDYITSMNSI